MRRGEEIRLHLERAAFEGKTVAHQEGLAVLVQGGAPGDTVTARITRVKKSFAEAIVLAVLEPSPLRVQPRCRYFGICGGCTWQHLSYDAQQAFKRQHVVDALERIGGFTGIRVNATLGADDSYFYRNKMEFSFGRRWLLPGEMAALPAGAGPGEGLFALGLHIPGRFDRVLDLEECWLQSAESAAIVNTVRDFARARELSIHSTQTHTGYLRNLVIREGRRTGDRMVNLVTSEDRPEVMRALTTLLLERFPSITTIVNNITTRMSQVALGDVEQVYHGPGTITERIGSRLYRISANSFFQTNTLQAERLYDTALRLAQLRPDDRVFDLYCGTGTIALHLADSAAQVIGVEAVPSAIEDARRNAAENGVQNCSFVLGDLREALTARVPQIEEVPPDVVVVDPPRAGMHEDVVRALHALGPRRIVYVSCNPATQARDLKLLCEQGRYQIEEVQPVDMFPQTFHIESVCALARVEGEKQ